MKNLNERILDETREVLTDRMRRMLRSAPHGIGARERLSNLIERMERGRAGLVMGFDPDARGIDEANEILDRLAEFFEEEAGR